MKIRKLLLQTLKDLAAGKELPGIKPESFRVRSALGLGEGESISSPRRGDRAHEIPNVPLLTEFAKTDEQREVLKLISSPMSLGRPFTAPPDIPAGRLAILRKAFAETTQDKAFLEEAQKLKLEIEPMNAEEVTQIVRDVVNAKPDVVAKARAMTSESK